MDGKLPGILEASQPAAASTSQGVHLQDVSCSSMGGCVACLSDASGLGQPTFCCRAVSMSETFVVGSSCSVTSSSTSVLVSMDSWQPHTNLIKTHRRTISVWSQGRLQLHPLRGLQSCSAKGFAVVGSRNNELREGSSCLPVQRPLVLLHAGLERERQSSGCAPHQSPAQSQNCAVLHSTRLQDVRVSQRPACHGERLVLGRDTCR